MRHQATLMALALPILVATSSDGDQSTPAKARGCATAQHRQFDFWLGEWDVQAGGTVAGQNRITSVSGGCALLEQWQGAGGGSGTSLNAYSVADGRWHQTWVDAQGGRLVLAGGWDEATGTMRLEGTTADRNGHPALNVISWQRLADGSVRQRWRVSPDNGTTWRELFDGVYRKRG